MSLDHANQTAKNMVKIKIQYFANVKQCTYHVSNSSFYLRLNFGTTNLGQAKCLHSVSVHSSRSWEVEDSKVRLGVLSLFKMNTLNYPTKMALYYLAMGCCLRICHLGSNAALQRTQRCEGKYHWHHQRKSARRCIC